MMWLDRKEIKLLTFFFTNFQGFSSNNRSSFDATTLYKGDGEVKNVHGRGKKNILFICGLRYFIKIFE